MSDIIEQALATETQRGSGRFAMVFYGGPLDGLVWWTDDVRPVWRVPRTVYPSLSFCSKDDNVLEFSPMPTWTYERTMTGRYWGMYRLRKEPR